jgi:hypothetical protein
VLTLALVPMGVHFGAAQQLLTTAALIVVLLVVEHRVDAGAGVVDAHRAG